MSWQKRKLSITTFGSTHELEQPDARAQSWDSITDYLANRPPSAASKQFLRLFKLAKFGDTPNPNGKHSYRWNGNVLHLSGIVADYDAGTVTPAEAAQRLQTAGVAAFIYTSPSHMQEGKGQRWRVLVPFEQDHPPEEHAAYVDQLNGALGGILAPESWVLTQPMYFGKVDGAIYETHKVDGKPLDRVADIKPIGKKGEQPVAATPPRSSVELLPTARMAELRRLVDRKDPDGDYETWLKVGQAIHHETQGGSDGLLLWDEWSARSGKYPGPEQIEYKWSSFGNSPNPVTAGWLRQGIVATVDDLPPPPTEDELDLLGDATKVTLELVPAREFARPQRVQYLVEDLIEEAQLFGLIGKRKGGKSYAALALSFAVAQGGTWCGQKVNATGRVVWIAAEGARSLQIRRLPQWLAHYGDANIDVWPHGLNMRSADTYKGLVEACKGAKLVVIDSLRRVTPGAKENSSDELVEVLAYAEQLTREAGCAVCFIAHASNKSKAEGDDMTARGSSVIEDQLEAGFFVEKVETESTPTFRITPGFARDEETGDGASIFFGLTHITPEGIEPGVVVNWDVKPVVKRELRAPAQTSATDTLTVKVLDSLWPMDGEPVINMDAFLGKYADSLPVPAGEDNRITKAQTALSALVKKGIVELDNAKHTITLLRSRALAPASVADTMRDTPLEDADADLL